MGPNLVDDIDCGNFFDQIDDLIEFPLGNECGGDGGGGVAGDLVGADVKDFPSMWSDALPDTDPFFSESGAASDLSAELSVPYDDIVQLEWFSTFMEDSFSMGEMTIGKEPSHNQFRTSSPVSVLESSSSSSCSEGKTTPFSPPHRGAQRARSKRPRPATFNPRVQIRALPKFVPTGFDNIAEVVPRPVRAKQKEKKKIKIALPMDEEHGPDEEAIRKCMHCEITKTPQWRAGPMGPKSLCNACGVRYKSGRLFPEYRPAASPTFVSSLHSNSHKKVVEMRTKLATTSPTADTDP